MAYEQILTAAGLTDDLLRSGTLVVTTPIDGSEIARVHQHSAADMSAMIDTARDAFVAWRAVPAPRRGNWSGSSVRSSGRPRRRWEHSYRSKPARSSRRASARCRR